MGFTEIISKDASKDVSEANGFQEIKSDVVNENRNAEKFWDDIFCDDETNNDIEQLDFDELLPEIFGRSTEEFSFDFYFDDDILDIMEKFKQPNWDVLDKSEKMDVAYEFVKLLGEKLRLNKTPDVSFIIDDPSKLGAFLPREKVLEINSGLMSNPVELMKTIAHEMRHAYQHERADNPTSVMDVLYGLNFANYISPVLVGDGKYLFFTDYQDQLVEAEARAFEKLFERMGGL